MTRWQRFRAWLDIATLIVVMASGMAVGIIDRLLDRHRRI